MSTPSSLPPKAAAAEKGMIPESVKTVLILILVLAVAYLWYDNSQFQTTSTAQMAKMSDEIKALDAYDKSAEAKVASNLTSLKGEIAEAQSAVGTTKEELKKTASQIQAEGKKTKAELSEAISSKADTSQAQAQLQAAKTDTESKIGQVTTEVGGVKNDVTAVRTDLAGTKRDLEGTQRQLLDVRETLTAAVAKNASELAQLRLKGERNYVEFQISKKNQPTKVEDIQIVLTKTDPKKGKFSLKVMADDSSLEKKDRTVNEPVQFLVGQNRVRYEVVINWVQKDKVGGYLSIPKDKALSAEHTAAAK